MHVRVRVGVLCVFVCACVCVQVCRCVGVSGYVWVCMWVVSAFVHVWVCIWVVSVFVHVGESL